MRNFYLVNSDGYSYNLTDNDNGVLFNEVSGLGYNRSDSYILIGNNYVLSDSSYDKGAPSGKLHFYGENPYKQFAEFVSFAAIEPLYLYYTPYEGSYDGDTTYIKKIRIPKLEKGELDSETGQLEISLTFDGLTPWYKTKTVTTVVSDDTESSDHAFIFPVKWDGKTNKFRSIATMKVCINSDTYLYSPCRLVIEGPITNPTWDHYVNGSKVTSGGVTCDVQAGNHLVIDNTGDSYEIAIYNSNDTIRIQDVYQNSDFSTDRFISLHHGENVVQVSGKDVPEVTIKLEAQLQYAAV